MGSLIRIIFGVPGAMVVTLTLFLVMNALISGTPELEDERDAVKIDINAKVPEIDEIAELTELERPVLDAPPPPPPSTVDPSDRPNIDGVSAQIPEIEVELEIGTSFNPDRDAQPLVRIPPQYPERCQGRSGDREFVVVQFDVDPGGQPQNIEVIDTSSSCFNRSAIRAVQRWKYQPKIVDNEAEWRRGVVTQFTFELGE